MQVWIHLLVSCVYLKGGQDVGIFFAAVRWYTINATNVLQHIVKGTCPSLPYVEVLHQFHTKVCSPLLLSPLSVNDWNLLD